MKRVEHEARSGFTLIELLVVVAIIGLLISILLPSLSRAKAQAKQLVGLTNLRSQGAAAFFYAEENREYIGGGIQGYAAKNEYNIYGLTVIKGLGYHDVETKDLFTGQTPTKQRKLRRTFAAIPQFQCPENPEPKQISPSNPDPQNNQVMDYLASATPIPYDRLTLSQDAADAGQAQPDNPTYRGKHIDGYTEVRKVDDLAAVANPAALIYVSEAGVYMSDIEMRYHHFFVTSQLPFGYHPRLANDQRHPGGLNNLFFDGHAKTIQPRSLDPGWPNSIGKRLRWFTVPDHDVTDAEWDG